MNQNQAQTVDTSANALVGRTPLYPRFPAGVPAGFLSVGRYRLRFAQDLSDLRAVQRLRFEVFNLELDEGLDEAFLLGRDEDEFDEYCHHLMVEEKNTGRVVGTYRFMLAETAGERGGFYSDTEFHFDGLPESVKESGAEIGRACVHADHRNGKVIHLLWKGLARYLTWNQRRYLFGCASLPTTDPSVGHLVRDALDARGKIHPEIQLRARDHFRCDDRAAGIGTDVDIPPLMESYLAMGARVCSEPALDAAFKVIDFFVVLDLDEVNGVARRRYLERNDWQLQN